MKQAVGKGSQVLINARLQVDGFAADCGVLTRVEGTSTFGKYRYEPSIFVGTHSISTEQKLELSFVGYVLERLQHMSPGAGRIIGMDGSAHTVKLGDSSKALRPLLEPLHEWITADSPKPPPIVLNKHCSLCPFQRLCQTQAEQEDNLSLLNGVTARVIRQYEKKGIFTVKQLSYLFKPRKPKKRSRKPPSVTHKVELQALAIREHKIYLQELPALSRQSVELFLDMEGVPDKGLYYLIGLLVCQPNTTEHHSFWANTDQDERHIWQQFVDTVTQYPDAPIYHYGSYEPRAIAQLAKRYDTDAESVLKRLVNVNRYIYGKVYFPVRSNGMKDIGTFIGAKWTSPQASGLQSLVWRHYWEATQEETHKDLLLNYNAEDCHALHVLTEALSKIQHASDTLSEVDFAHQPKQHATEVGVQVHRQFTAILKFAHADYDKKKISFRKRKDVESEQPRNKTKSRAHKGYHGPRHTKHKATKVVEVPQETFCPKHQSELLLPTASMSKRRIIDLVLARNGIRKTITEYVGVQGYCPKCSHQYAPSSLKEYGINQVYGHGFRAWNVYQRVALRMPYEGIVEMMAEQFHEKIPGTSLPNFIRDFACSYATTEESLTQRLLASPFVHADETPVNIRGVNHYVWVFTDGQSVVFQFTERSEER